MLVLYIFGSVYVLCLAILVAVLVLAKRQDTGRRRSGAHAGELIDRLARSTHTGRHRDDDAFRTVH